MKRLNIFLLIVVLLLVTSCGNSFFSKISTKDSIDISISLPIEALKASASKASAARGATDNSNKLTIALYINDDTKYETVITDFNKSVETTTFSNIPIGSLVRAEATFIYEDQKYFGESETITVTDKTATLSVVLQKVKPKEKQEKPASLLAEPTDQGVKLTLTDLPREAYIRILTKGNSNNWYERFSFFAGTSTYTFIDKYVDSGETITYSFIVEKKGTSVASEPITVTTIGGSGRPVVSATKTSTGIELTVQSALPHEKVEIFRQENGSNNTGTINIYKESPNEIFTKTVTDYFVTPGTEYYYSVSTFLSNYDNQGILYNPRSNIITITAEAGLGDITITNTPVATYDSSTMTVNFSTPPVAGITSQIPDLSIGMEFIYTILPGPNTIDVQYFFDADSYGLNWMPDNADLAGETLQLVTEPLVTPLYRGYAYDSTNKISYYIDHYETLDFSKMPQIIQIPNNSSSQNITTTVGQALDVIQNISGPTNLTITGEANDTILPQIAQAITNLQLSPSIALDLSGVTGVSTISAYAFKYCTPLSYIKLPDGITEIEQYAFLGCYFTEIEFPEGLTSIGECAFCDCSYLESISLPTSLASIGENAFGRSRNLSTITIPQENKTFSVIDNVLFGNAGTTLIRYPSALTATSYTVPDGVITIAGDAFSDCNNLESIVLPDGLESIGKTSFAWCQNLQNINIPSTVTSMDWSPFKYCYNLKAISVATGNTKFKDVDGILFAIDDSEYEISLIQYPPSKEGQSYTVPNTVTTIEASAFNFAKNLTSVTLGTGVETIKFWAFDGAELITSLEIPANVIKLEAGALSGSYFETLTFIQTDGWKYKHWNEIQELVEEPVSADVLANPSNFTEYNSLFNQYDLYREN